MYDVHMILDFLTSYPLCLQQLCTVCPQIWGRFFTPFPLLCGRHTWKPQKREGAHYPLASIQFGRFHFCLLKLFSRSLSDFIIESVFIDAVRRFFLWGDSSE